jgi:coenzyme F420-dependent glucose-6-phosphate dehydrogenase
MAKIFYYLGHEQFQPETLVKHAQLAEAAGFDGVFASEHFNPWVADLGAAGFGFSTLGAIAVTTKHVELMTGVVTPLFRYHPAVVAQAAATIDRLSEGRFWLGVGTGESINETPLGYTYPGYKERSQRMQEALTIMKQLFAGEKVTFDGEYYKTKNAKLYSPPVHPIPILLAAGGSKTAMLAGEQSDGIIISVKDPKDALEKVITPAKTAAKQKPFTVTASRWTIFAVNDDDAWQAIQPWRGLRAPNRDTASDPETLQKEADAISREEILSRYTIVKTADEYVDAYAPLITDVNADIVAIQTTSTDQEKTIKFLGDNVLPRLKELITIP